MSLLVFRPLRPLNYHPCIVLLPHFGLVVFRNFCPFCKQLLAHGHVKVSTAPRRSSSDGSVHEVEEIDHDDAQDVRRCMKNSVNKGSWSSLLSGLSPSVTHSWNCSFRIGRYSAACRSDSVVPLTCFEGPALKSLPLSCQAQSQSQSARVESPPLVDLGFVPASLIHESSDPFSCQAQAKVIPKSNG